MTLHCRMPALDSALTCVAAGCRRRARTTLHRVYMSPRSVAPPESAAAAAEALAAEEGGTPGTHSGCTAAAALPRPNHNSDAAEHSFAFHSGWSGAVEEAGGDSCCGRRGSRWVEAAAAGGCIDAWWTATGSLAVAGSDSGLQPYGRERAGWSCRSSPGKAAGMASQCRRWGSGAEVRRGSVRRVRAGRGSSVGRRGAWEVRDVLSDPRRWRCWRWSAAARQLSFSRPRERATQCSGCRHGVLGMSMRRRALEPGGTGAALEQHRTSSCGKCAASLPSLTRGPLSGGAAAARCGLATADVNVANVDATGGDSLSTRAPEGSSVECAVWRKLVYRGDWQRAGWAGRLRGLARQQRRGALRRGGRGAAAGGCCGRGNRHRRRRRRRRGGVWVWVWVWVGTGGRAASGAWRRAGGRPDEA